MKLIKTLYHFFGSLIFALILITCAALFVITGTVLESITSSHLFAAQYTYHHPIFLLLLICFFVNILFSATRRWPFKKKHISFLITHLGLLMVIGGTFIKNIYGIQGTMGLMEGTASSYIFLPNTYSVSIEKKRPARRTSLTLNKNGLSPILDPNFQNLKVELKEYAPNVAERQEIWIKGNHAVISGFPALPLSKQARIKISEDDPIIWNLTAIQSSDPIEAIKKAYLQDLKVTITAKSSNEKLEVSGSDLFEKPISFQNKTITSHLELSDPYHLALKITDKNNFSEEVIVPLSGEQALSNINPSSKAFGSALYTIDLNRDPAIHIIQDNSKDEYMVLFSQNGAISIEKFVPNHLSSVYMIDDGFHGYTLQTDLKIPQLSRKENEQKDLSQFEDELRQIVQNEKSLLPPLNLLREACEESNQDFAHVLNRFFNEWDKSHSWLYPASRPLPKDISQVMQKLDIAKLPKKCRLSCSLASLLISHIEPQIKAGKEIQEALMELQWPLLSSLEIHSNQLEPSLALLHQQFDMISQQIPDMAVDLPLNTPEEKAHFLSAFLRNSGVHYQEFYPPIQSHANATISLETPLTLSHQSIPATSKLEDNVPGIKLHFDDGEISETIALAYDPYGKGLKWPVGGRYLARFQPIFKTIPFTVRVRDARQVNIPGTNQPHSYECDVVITDNADQSFAETTISMNNVHETWNGYRFYLANISPAEETSPQHVQIIVNYDPAKYLLTYPGAILVFIGILLLFWLQPYKKR